jgi:hypothetical protein
VSGDGWFEKTFFAGTPFVIYEKFCIFCAGIFWVKHFLLQGKLTLLIIYRAKKIEMDPDPFFELPLITGVIVCRN